MLANVGIERAVISSLCQYGKYAINEIEDIGVDINSFTVVSNQALFSSIKQLLENNEKIDQALLLVTIKDLGYINLFDTKKDIEYIASLFTFPIRQDNIRSFAIRLEKLKLARTAIQKHQEAIDSLTEITGTEKVEDIVQISENPIFDLILDVSKNKDSGPQLLFENIEEIVEELTASPCDNIGIPTPWANYNAAIGGGLRRGGVNLTGARPKIGKTTLAKELLLHVTTELNIPALMLDTEMSSRDQKIRSLASCSEVPLSDIESGKFIKNYLFTQNVNKAVQKLKNNKNFWYISVAGKPFDEILAIIRRWIVKNVGYDENGNINNCVVIYDYFKLMDSSQLQHLKEYEAMGYQISKLTDFCKEFDFACFAFVQLNRQNDISQSDRLRWLCHSYSTFEKKTPEETVDDGANGGNRKLTIMDTRYGGGLGDNDYICLDFKRDINKIVEIGLRSKLADIHQDVNKFEEYTQSEVIKTEIIEQPKIEYDDDEDSEEKVPWNE